MTAFALCDMCWFQLNPYRRPARFREPVVETCRRCAEPTRSGIYVAHDPSGKAA